MAQRQRWFAVVRKTAVACCLSFITLGLAGTLVTEHATALGHAAELASQQADDEENQQGRQEDAEGSNQRQEQLRQQEQQRQREEQRRSSARSQQDEQAEQDAGLGVLAADTSDEEGVKVSKIYPNSPAQRAGLQPNDVISSVNGQEVASVEALERVISRQQPGSRVRLEIQRNGAERTLQVTLGERDSVIEQRDDDGQRRREEASRQAQDRQDDRFPRQRPGERRSEESRQSELRQDQSSRQRQSLGQEDRQRSGRDGQEPEDRATDRQFEREEREFRREPGGQFGQEQERSRGERFGREELDEGERFDSQGLGRLGITIREARGQGVVVARVTARSAAAGAGLQAGDEIVMVEAQPVSSEAELMAILRESGGERVRIEIRRQGQERTVVVPVATTIVGERSVTTRRRGDQSDMQGALAQLLREVEALRMEVSHLRREVEQLSNGRIVIVLEPADLRNLEQFRRSRYGQDESRLEQRQLREEEYDTRFYRDGRQSNDYDQPPPPVDR